MCIRDSRWTFPPDAEPSTRLALSVAVFEPFELVEQIVRNYLRFTTNRTRIVLHASHDANYTLSDSGWRQLLAHPRVAMNPQRISTGWCSPGIFRAHLSNALFIAKHLGTEGIFLPMSSNAFFFRSGVEQQVAEMRLSVCDGRADNGMTRLDTNNKHVDKHCLLYTSPSPRDLSTSRMPSSA